MEKQGFVSVWIGKAINEQLANASLVYKYTEDGDLIESWFTTHFQIFHLDEDFTETVYVESQDLLNVLPKASYANSFLPQLLLAIERKNLFGSNLAFLLYNFDYAGQVQVFQSPEIVLNFVGSFPYSG